MGLASPFPHCSFLPLPGLGCALSMGPPRCPRFLESLGLVNFLSPGVCAALRMREWEQSSACTVQCPLTGWGKGNAKKELSFCMASILNLLPQNPMQGVSVQIPSLSAVVHHVDQPTWHLCTTSDLHHPEAGRRVF